MLHWSQFHLWLWIWFPKHQFMVLKTNKKGRIENCVSFKSKTKQAFYLYKNIRARPFGLLIYMPTFLKYEQGSRRKEGQIVYGWFPLSKSLLDGINLPKGKWEFVRSWNFFQPHEELKRTLLLETIQVGGEEHSNLKKEIFFPKGK